MTYTNGINAATRRIKTTIWVQHLLAFSSRIEDSFVTYTSALELKIISN